MKSEENFPPEEFDVDKELVNVYWTHPRTGEEILCKTPRDIRKCIDDYLAEDSI